MPQEQFVDFGRNFLDPETPLTRIGHGELGGKAHGLASIRGVLNASVDPNRFPGITVDIPPMAVLCTNVFDIFMQRNDLYKIADSDLPDDRIVHAFQKAELPFDVLGDLRALVNQVHTPLAVRSSSLLEDARQAPFAGIYATKMIPNSRYDPDSHFRQLVEAIKFVYASTFSRSAKDYRYATGHREESEKMAVIIQELVGKRHHHRFYPELSGVARSYNYYPMGSAKAEEGVASLALGLGKTIVDGGRCWSYSPAYPKVGPPFGSVEELFQGTQTEFWAVNMGESPKYDPTHETEYLLLENLTIAERDGALRYLASTYSPLSGRLSIGTGFDGPRALTFAPILILEELPLNYLLAELLQTCETALDAPVEIEFAMTFNPHLFRFLQVRPMEASSGETHLEAQDLLGENVLVATETALGNGVVDTIYDIVYTKPESFDLRHTLAIVPELESFNRKLLNAGRPYLLIVLGRLGTTDPWLGIPTNWGKISGARAVVEATQENVRVELSQGTHFFHNIVSLGVKYFNLPHSRRNRINWSWLGRQESAEENRFLRHVRLTRPLQVKVDGRSGRGVIHTPQDEKDEDPIRTY
jgi:hypothetical protein